MEYDKENSLFGDSFFPATRNPNAVREYYKNANELSKELGIPEFVSAVVREKGGTDSSTKDMVSGCHISGRIHLAPFLRWWFANSEKVAGTIDWVEKKNKEMALKGELQRKQLEGKLVTVSDVEEGVSTIMSAIFGTLELSLLREFPQLLSGKSDEEIGKECKKLFSNLREIVIEKFNAMLENAKKDAFQEDAGQTAILQAADILKKVSSEN